MVNKILIVEDNPDIQDYLKELFLNNGFSVQTAADGIIAMNQVNKSLPDLIVLDLGLPNTSGEAVCTEIKKANPDLPVIILTAKDTSPDIVNDLSLGADDYISKPFVADELLARVKARLRQGGKAKIQIDDLEIDTNALQVNRGGKLIQLSPQEFNLLHYLAANKGRVLTREMILNRVWRYSDEVDTRVVDVYIGYLRKKIDNEHKIKLIHSIRGFGYMIKED